uniref:DUF1618 domain-containing protein n=1 Tax=Arundo donax TaxID=35708 RepID=A0A0A9BAP5_ARUDO
MWSLGGADGDHRWECDFSVPFGDIWADASYAAATEPPLVKEVPVLALVHPYDPAVVYFWEPLGGARLFSVNVPAKKVIECGEQFSIPDYGIPEAEFPSSRTIHAWHLPPPLHYRLHGSAVLRALLCLCGPDDLPDEEQSSAVGFTLHM